MSSCLVRPFSTPAVLALTTSSWEAKTKQTFIEEIKSAAQIRKHTFSWPICLNKQNILSPSPIYRPVFVCFIATVPFVKHHGVASYISGRPHNHHFLQLNPAQDDRVSMNEWNKCRIHSRCDQKKDELSSILFPLVSGPPDAKVIIFPTPTPVSVWESVHLAKLRFGHSCDSSKVAFVTQPESGRMQRQITVLCLRIILGVQDNMGLEETALH